MTTLPKPPDAHGARWVVTRPARIAGEIDLYWEGPVGRLGCWDAFGPIDRAATWPTEATALEALVLTFGLEWERHRSLDGARVALLNDSDEGRTTP